MKRRIPDEAPILRSTAFQIQVELQPGMYSGGPGSWKFRCFLCHEIFQDAEQIGPYPNCDGWVSVCKACIDAHNAQAEAARE